MAATYDALIETDYYRYYLVGEMGFPISSRDLPMDRVARVAETLMSVPVGSQAAPVSAVIEILDPAAEDEPAAIEAVAPWIDLGCVDMVIDDRFTTTTGISRLETSLIPPQQITPGWYRVQVHARGREEASRHAVLTAPVEHHRILLRQLPAY